MNSKKSDRSSSGKWINLSTGGGTSSELRRSVKSLQEQAAQERKIFAGERLCQSNKKTK